MKFIITLTLALLFSFSVYADSCEIEIINGLDSLHKGENGMENAQKYFEKAYEEFHKKKPNKHLACNALDRSGEIFEISRDRFKLCFNYYKNAETLCQGQAKQLEKVYEGINNCDVKVGEAQGALDAVNLAYEEDCGKL